MKSLVILAEEIIYGGTVRSISKELNVDLTKIETVDDLLR